MVVCKVVNDPKAAEEKQGSHMRDAEFRNTEDQGSTAGTLEAFIPELFRKAMCGYEKALKTGIQVQEESMNLWKDVLTKLGSPEEFQVKLESIPADAFPRIRKRMEEFVETFNRTSNQTIDLFEKDNRGIRPPR